MIKNYQDVYEQLQTFDNLDLYPRVPGYVPG